MGKKKEKASKELPKEPMFGIPEIPLLQETQFSAGLTLRQQAIYYIWVRNPYIKRITLAEQAGVSISSVKRFFKENEEKIKKEKVFLYENLVDVGVIAAIFHGSAEHALKNPSDTKATKPFVDHVLNRAETGSGISVTINFGRGDKDFPSVYDEETDEAEAERIEERELDCEDE